MQRRIPGATVSEQSGQREGCTEGLLSRQTLAVCREQAAIKCKVKSRAQTPLYERRGSGDVWPIPWVSLMLITFWREISFHQSHCRNTIFSATLEILGHFSTMTRQFFVRKLAISSQLCIHQATNFVMKLKEWVGSGHETNVKWGRHGYQIEWARRWRC